MTSHAPRKRHRRPPADDITPETPIWCPACETTHPASAFNRESSRFSGLAGICREAQARARRTPKGVAATVARNKRRWADPSTEPSPGSGSGSDVVGRARRLIFSAPAAASRRSWMSGSSKAASTVATPTFERSIPTISTVVPRTATCLGWYSYVRRQPVSARNWQSAFLAVRAVIA